MSVNLSPFAGAGAQFFTDAGTPLTGGLLYSYAAGTTTPATTYTEYGGTVANSNPIVLDAAGRVPYEIWLTAGSSYKFILKTSVGTTIGTWDNIDGINDVAAGTAFYADAFTTTAGQTTFTLSANPGSINNLNVSLDGATLVAGDDFTWTGTTIVLSMAAYADQRLRVAYSSVAGVKAISPGSVVDASVAVGTKLYNRINDIVDVKDYGAKGDGTTDDTAAFAAALASGAMRIHVPYTGSQYVISSALSVPRGVILFGDTLDQPGILCKTATAGDIVFFTLTGNTQLENLRIYGDSATSGTLVSLTGGTYTFTGNIRLNNVRFYQAKVGLFINSIFNARMLGCEFRGCKRGVDASPLTDGGDNGYLNAITFDQCYFGGNTDYDVYANPAVRVSVLSFLNNTFDPGPTIAKVYLKSANPCSFKDCYFEGGSTLPAIKGSLSTVTVETCYFNGTKGIEYDNTQASLVMRQSRTTSTDIINAGYALHTVRIMDTTLPSSGNVFNTTSVKYFDNAVINGTSYSLVRNESTTFTPTLTGTGGTSANTYVWQAGFYTRIDNVIHFSGVIRVSALDAGMTGTVRINLVGLPTSQNTTLNNIIAQVMLQSVTLSASRNHAVGRIDLNTNYMDIYEEGSNVTASAMPVANLTATSIIWFSGHYLLAPGS